MAKINISKLKDELRQISGQPDSYVLDHIKDVIRDWDGGKLLYDVRRWLVRPGDLVGVDRSGRKMPPGVYVPLDTILEKYGSKYVFAVSESSEGDVARRVEVNVHDSAGTLRRIDPASDQPLTIGTKVIVEGAAFLVDGERINVAREIEPGR